MGEIEGVIKYRLDFSRSAPPTENLDKLNCWRSILYGLGLIGQKISRYEGYGFGNLSQRCQLEKSQFIISGSQTGNLTELTRSHYVRVEYCDVSQNQVIASGPLKPSSEALTHSMFYELDASVKCVLHVHAPDLWNFALHKPYACTAETIEYGTQEMAAEIARLYRSGSFLQHQTLVMAGHEDGIICFGASVDEAAMSLLDLWVKSSGN